MSQFSEAILRAADQLEITVRRRASQQLIGNYRSPYRGSGMQFKEFRAYEPGDDIRHMSWAVTARTQKPTIKVYEEEREVSVVVICDTSGSSLFGTKLTKAQAYRDLMSVIGLSCFRNGNSFGSVYFDREIVDFVPAKKSRDQIFSTLGRLDKIEVREMASDLRPVLRKLMVRLRQSSVVIILSDFLMPDFSEEFRIFSKRHETILLHCFPPEQVGRGLKGLYRVHDPETGRFFFLDGLSRKLRSTLAKDHVGLSKRLKGMCHDTGSDYVALPLEQNYLDHLVHFFHERTHLSKFSRIR